VYYSIKKYFGLLALLSATTITLFDCGGGSSSAPTLNLFAAWKTYTTEGYFLTGVISGYCQGTRAQTLKPVGLGQNVTTPPVSAFIQDVSEIDVLGPNQSTLCTSLYGNPAFRVYYDPVAFTPMTDGLEPKHYVYSNQVAHPTSVTAGSKGTFLTSLNYAGTANPVSKGVVSWEVKADTATTLLWITTNTATTLDDRLLFKSITTYRLNANNTITDLRKNIQLSNLATGGNGDQNIYETY